MRNQTARRVALTGMLFALAMALSFFESALTPLLGLPPGVKPGLANVVVLYALLFLSRRHALALVVLKAGFSLLTRGGTAGILSLAGGLLSFVLMTLLLLPQKNKVSLLLVSVAGALGHNLGQFAAIRVMLGPAMWGYLPVLLVSGVAMGTFTALTLRALAPALARTGLAEGKEAATKKPPTEK